MGDAWSCGTCAGPNLPEDRYCGDCGEPREASVAAPAPAARQTVSGLLPDVKETPSGSAEGATRVILAGLAAAAVFGAALHFVARVFDLKILFPILLGVAIAWAIKVAAIRGRFHRTALLVLIAALAGAGSYAFRQTLDTLHERAQLHQFIAKTNKENPRELVIPPGFVATLKLRAETGIGFGGTRRVHGRGFWIFLLVEAALVAGVAAASVHPLSRLSYCGRCREFVPPVPVFRVNGRDSKRLADIVRRQKWKAAQEMSDRASPTPGDRAEATLLSCVRCADNTIRVDLYEGRRAKKIMHVALPPESLKALARGD